VARPAMPDRALRAARTEPLDPAQERERVSAYAGHDRSRGHVTIRHSAGLIVPPTAHLSSIRERMNPAYRPMLATLVDEPFDSKDWVFETKWDGIRLISEKRGKAVKLWSRNGVDVTARWRLRLLWYSRRAHGAH
jgi:ATP-dependent DNA ligase